MQANPEKARSIFIRAIEEHSPAEWDAYVAEACRGDEDLRRRVEVLLRAHREPDSLLDGSLGAAHGEHIREARGTVIGPYKLLEEIGEGGFGVVYMAEQEEPVRRRVALKVIKPGMDTRQVIARFEAERQALALMDHANVARVLDAGATESGRPYFVMDLIRGIPITEYSDQAKLSTRERLELFLQVCLGVEHAHQKGIIHRDLKPSNVLVTLQDGKPVPRVIDFGVAKAIHGRLTERTLFTGFAQMVGTPLYMSPEQAALSAHDVDTRSDIYSLGVLLYELLTGTRPLEPSRLSAASQEEIRRAIREEEPPTPSHRIATTEAMALRAIASSRQIEPRKLAHLLRGDLDWITMKALEKDRARRYETTNALGADIERYLSDEPIQARPPSALYRARKFARRNRGALAMASSMALALLLAIGGAAGSAGWSLRERTERIARIGRDVETALEESKRLREEAWSLSEEPARFEAKLAAAFSALERAESLLRGTGKPADPELPERVRALRTELEEDEKDRRMMAALDRIYLEKISQFDFIQQEFLYPRTLAAYRDAFDRHGIRRSSTSPEEAAAVILGLTESARETFIAAVDDWLSLAEEAGEPEAEWLRSVLAAVDRNEWRKAVRAARVARDREALVALGERPETARQPPVSLGLLGSALVDLGAGEEAVAVARRAQKLHPGNARVNLLLGKRLDGAKSPEAITCFRIVVALLPGSADAHLALGSALLSRDDLAGARESLEKAIEIEPEHALALFNLSSLLARQGDLDGATRCLREVARLEPEADVVHSTLGISLLQQNDIASAIESFGRAVALAPNEARYHGMLGQAFEKKGDLQRAMESYRRAIELGTTDARPFHSLGLALAKRGDHAGAIDSFRKALELAPHDPDALNNLGSSLCARGYIRASIDTLQKVIELAPAYARARNNLGYALQEKGDYPAAIESIREAIRIQPNYLLAHNNLGTALESKGDLDGAASSYRDAIRLRPDFAVGHCNLGGILLTQGNLPGAIASLIKAIELEPLLPQVHGKLDQALRVHPGDRPVAAAHEGLWKECLPAYEVYDKALRERPELGRDPLPLYIAVRLAALAARAPAANPDELDQAARARLHSEAHDRMRALLELWLGSRRNPAALHAFQNVLLDAWRNPCLASLRDPAELEKLPSPEPMSFRALRGDVARAGIGILERLVERGDRTLEPELRRLRLEILPDLPTFASIDAAIESSGIVSAGDRQQDGDAFQAFRNASGDPGGVARVTYLDGRLYQLRGEHERALAEFEKAAPCGEPEPLVRILQCLRALGREAAAEARLRSALVEGSPGTDRLWIRWHADRGKTIDEIVGGWPEGSRSPLELPPPLDPSLRAVPLDLGPHFERDVVADPGDSENDFLDADTWRLVVLDARAEGPVLGLPPGRAIGIHRLGEYAAKNVLQFSRESRETVRLAIPGGSYRELRFLVTGLHGESGVPLRLEYADGRRSSAEVPCVDWFGDAADGLPEGVVPVWNGMDASSGDRLERAGDAALFEWTLAVDGGAELTALELDPAAGRYSQAGTRFNLLAITAIAEGE